MAPKIMKSLIAEMLKPARELNKPDVRTQETNIVTRMTVSNLVAVVD